MLNFRMKFLQIILIFFVISCKNDSPKRDIKSEQPHEIPSKEIQKVDIDKETSENINQIISIVSTSNVFSEFYDCGCPKNPQS